MSEDDPFTGKLSEKQSRELFFNAENDPDVQAMFTMVSKQVLPAQKPEVREEAKRIDPFEHIHARNAELDAVRAHVALQSDSRQVLVKHPHALPVKQETVSLDELPSIVRQSAEAVLLQRLQNGHARHKQHKK
jgi:hypothetical protein